MSGLPVTFTPWAILVFGAYLLGSLSSAVLVAKLFSLPDPRTAGSQNPGATNVLRLGGKKAAAITLAGDILKGFIPVSIAYALDVLPIMIAITGLAAFLGHLFPVFFGFKGGKGVATALGVLLGLNPTVGLAVLAVWLATALITHYSSLAALLAAACAPLFMALLANQPSYTTLTVIMSAMLYWRHRENIRRLRAGTEGRFGR